MGMIPPRIVPPRSRDEAYPLVCHPQEIGSPSPSIEESSMYIPTTPYDAKQHAERGASMPMIPLFRHIDIYSMPQSYDAQQHAEYLKRQDEHGGRDSFHTIKLIHTIQREIDREPTTQYVTESGMVISYE